MAKKKQKINLNKVLIVTIVISVLLILTLSILVKTLLMNISETNNQSAYALSREVNNATLILPDSNQSITFEKGKSEFTIDDASGTAVIGNIIARSNNDIFVNYSVNTGGSGTFTYVAYFKQTNMGLQYVTSVSIGDRVPVESITLSETTGGYPYTLSVIYFDRAENQPMAEAPTVPTTLNFTVEKNSLTQQAN